MKPRTIAFPCVLLLSACGLFDSGVEWRRGRYALMWVDSKNDMSLSVDQGHGGWAPIVPPVVFAVGANDDFIVAKQHPRGDTTITNYFIIPIEAPDSSLDPAKRVIGPLSNAAFGREARIRSLPKFTKP
jgi:hypothetical protein